jgi:formylglycine-generating enzyme required for sulfatase activity
MGSPVTEKGREAAESQHAVTISKAFYMGKYTVTQEQYEKVMGSNPSKFKGAKKPVENVSWDDAQEFCRKLSTTSAKTVRLPTEAEWEYACRAGSATAYCFGDDEAGLAEYAWHGTSGTTDPVGEKKPNAWGLYDMHRNVYEWCQDRYGDYPAGAATDPQGPVEGADRVMRGGCWVTSPGDCRSAHRIKVSPSIRGVDFLGMSFGFRVVVAPH